MNIENAIDYLHQAVTILKDNNINNICLIQGTLLGAYRDKQIIPHDHDIDLLIINYNIDKLIDKFPGWDICDYLKGKFISFKRRDVIIDIQTGKFEEGLFITETPATIDKYPDYLFRNLTTIDLYGITFSAPNPIEECLHLTYGDWQTLREGTDRDNLFERIWKI